MRDLNKAMKKLQEAKRLESTKLAKLVKESVVEPEDKEETFDNKFNYKVSLDNGKTITATCSKENIEDARKYFLGKSYLNTKTGEKAKIVGVEEINSDENGFEEIKNEEFGSTSKQLTDNDPAQKVPFDSDAKKDIEKAATQKPKIVAEEFGSENKDLTDNDPAQKKAFETETRKKMDDATKGKTIDDKIDESKKLNEATEEDINNENKLEKAKQLIEVIFNMDSLDETRRAAKQELKDLVYPQRIEPEKTEKKIVKESIFDNDEETKVKEDRLADLRTQLECDGDQLADDEKEAIQAEIDSLEKDLYESKQLNEGTLGKTLEIIYTDNDGEEKATHFECDKEYELDGEQIREAIKSSDSDIVDIIKINESKCLTEDDDHEEDEEDEDEFEELENLDEEKPLTETTDKEIEKMKQDLYARERQALKDLGDENWEDIVGLSGRMPEEMLNKFLEKREIINTIEMIHSILTYTSEANWNVDYVMNNKYMQRHIKELGEEKVKELAEQEIEEYKQATINKDVYTDSEDISYNSVTFKDDVNESKNITEDEEIEDEQEETLDEAIKRAYEEEISAINTYDTVLSKTDESTDAKLIEMINEIKKDEEDHKTLLQHYIETGEALTDDELEELKNSEESNEDNSEEEVSIENIDDETFTEAFTKFIKENYKNAKEFKLENVIKSGNKYKFECKLTFNSGKQVKVNLMSEAKIREGKSLIRFYENKTFKHLDENKSIMTATVKLENKTLSCEALRYNYRVALKENKIATIKGIIK